jgi:hypothetical protein
MSLANTASAVYGAEADTNQRETTDVKGDELQSTLQVSSPSRKRTLSEKGKAWKIEQLKAKRKSLSTQLIVKS